MGDDVETIAEYLAAITVTAILCVVFYALSDDAAEAFRMLAITALFNSILAGLRS